jgi:hypothetical protein
MGLLQVRPWQDADILNSHYISKHSSRPT